jgi:hypothetical protein
MTYFVLAVVLYLAGGTLFYSLIKDEVAKRVPPDPLGWTTPMTVLWVVSTWPWAMLMLAVLGVTRALGVGFPGTRRVAVAPSVARVIYCEATPLDDSNHLSWRSISAESESESKVFIWTEGVAPLMGANSIDILRAASPVGDPDEYGGRVLELRCEGRVARLVCRCGAPVRVRTTEPSGVAHKWIGWQELGTE